MQENTSRFRNFITCAWRILNCARSAVFFSCYHADMHDLIVLLVHFITTVLRLTRPGGLRSVVAEPVLIKHQLLIVNRSRHRAPNLRALDRLIVGFCSLWIKPTRLLRAAIALKPSICCSRIPGTSNLPHSGLRIGVHG
jgi:hypothetical protein